MEGNQQDKNQNRNAEQCRRAVRSPIVRMLAFVVAFCTVFSLIPPTAIMAVPEQTLDCPLSIHQHEAACYDAENALICGMADFVVHTHDDNCYDADASLVCTLEEIRVHEHSAECFTTEQNLICELAEDETHTHGDGCYESVQTLTCVKEEVILHTHSDSCQDENGDLTCGMLEVVEHVHGDGCFTEAADNTTPTTEPTVETTTETTVETTTETTEATESTEATEALIAPVAAEVIASGICGENANWVLTDDGVLTISGSGSMDNYRSGNSPWYFNRSLIKSVIIENGVTSIGDSAFSECDSLTSVTIPDSVTSIGGTAFYRCSSLTSITLPDSLTSIGGFAFRDCSSLTSITLPDGVTSIGDYAFRSCSNLTSITLPDSVTSIGSFAFEWCSNLTDIAIPGSVTSIGDSAFSGCSSLTEIVVDGDNQNYCSADGVLYSKDQTTLYIYPEGKADSAEVTLPEGVISIGDSAFSGCSSLTSITLPDSLTSIGSSAFENCSSLTSITIPDSVTSIGDAAFRYCSSLTDINIPDSLTSIGVYAFGYCSSLTSVTIPGSVTSIGSFAFSSCSSLTSITLPDSLTSIGSSAFGYCSSLTSVTLPDSVTSIGDSAFYNCSSLTDITIPGSVTSIGRYAFGDSGLANVTIQEGVTSIGKSAFEDCSSLTDITLPDSVTSIGDSAFRYCSSLTSITLPDSLTSIGSSAFGYCSSLVDITIESSFVKINSTAFNGCTQLKSVTIGKNVDTITSDLLNTLGKNSGGLTKISFSGPNYFTYNGSDYTIGGLTLTAGDYFVDENGIRYRLKSDGTATLLYCPKDLVLEQHEILETIPSEDGSLTYTVTAIADFAFKGCSGLKDILIPDTVAHIGAYAFYDCDGLTEIILPDTISHIGACAFYECTNLANVNGYTTLSDLMQAWSSAGVDYSTFYKTALYREDIPISTSDIEIEDDTGRRIEISTEKREVLTGEKVQTVLTIDKGDEDSNCVVRVYFQFFNPHGSLNYKVDSYDFDGIPAKVCKATHPYTYYVEIDPLLAGQTLKLNLDSVYENVVSGNADAWIWVVALPVDDAAEIGNDATIPEIVHQVTWSTQTDTFPVTKTAGSGGTVNSYGILTGLNYTITMSRKGNTSAYGKDYMVSVDFVDTLTLPEHFHWRDGLVEAVRANHWYTYTAYNEIRYYVTIGQKTYLLARIPSANKSDPSLTVDNAGNIQVCWTIPNPNTSKEMQAASMQISFGDDVILADIDAVNQKVAEAGGNIVCDFNNKVTAIQHFTHSADQTQEATAPNPISVAHIKPAEYTISKTASGSSLTMGEKITFTITLRNKNTQDYASLDYVTDPLPNYFYISPADMQTMFSSAPYGKDLSITIEHATLCTPVSNTVIGTDGNSYVITQQYQGVNIPYDGKAPVGSDESVIASDATLTLGWSEDQATLVLVVGENSYSIGSGCTYSSIQEALDSIGYVITDSTIYTCCWNQAGKTLECGATRSFEILATAKDTFMRLIGDQNWYIIKDYTYQQSVTNYAYSYSVDGNYQSTNSTTSSIFRDFVLNKEAFLNGILLEDGSFLVDGTVFNYQTVIEHRGQGAYEALPLVDRMEGAQVLLVSVADNPTLADKGLETMDVDGTPHYIMNKAGVYQTIKVGDYLANRVEIQSTDSGLDTMIYWYLMDVSGDVTITVEYPVLVSPEHVGITIESGSYSLSDGTWLNDHQTHRLFDRAFVGGKNLEINKYIVTNIPETEVNDLSAHDPSADELTKRSIVKSGQTVTYRLSMDFMGEKPHSVLGSYMLDALPASLNEYWNKDNVTVTYIPEEGAYLQLENEDSWRIETDAEDPNQQYIRWNEDFSVTAKGIIYIYVTLTYPTGAQWSDYCHAYGSVDLTNTFRVNQLKDEAFNLLTVPAEVLLQKGVYSTGIQVNNSTFRENTHTDSLLYYTNDSYCNSIVTYYVTIYNSGESRVYLSGIQDALPQGFTFVNVNAANGSGNISYSDAGQSQVTFMSANVTADTRSIADGRQVIVFNLSNTKNGHNLGYDEQLDKYYLNSGEAIVFTYRCRTNSVDGSQDIATNVVSMPFYDYNGTGVNLDAATVVDRAETGNMTSNNGNRFVTTTGQADLWGMSTFGYDNSTHWLASEVTLYRDSNSILPGITKTAARSFAHVTDSINWSIRVDNSGKDNMRDYTLTDVMMAPYQFTGTVSYGLSYGNHTNIYLESPNLFTFGQRTPGDNKVTITSDIGNTVELIVNGGYQYIRAYIYCYDNGRKVGTGIVTVAVRLSRDTNGSEVLSVFFPEDTTYIPPNGYAMLTLKTQNFGTAYKNTSFFNTAYITPSEDQPFDTGAVSQGNYTIYNEADSVVSEANVAVSFGYATTSFTGVSELSNPSNSASSIGSTDHIVLSDAASPFRYALTVNNTGGTATSQAMDSLVLIDNLPQIGDHVTFYQEISRFSEFQVNFEEDPAFAVSVDGAVLDPGSYTLQFSKATEFGDGDWRGTGTDGWYTLEQIDADAALSLKDMRSFRVVIRDDTGTVIPTEAQITVSFNAEVDLSKGDIPPAATAWNSFGYHYSIVDDETELEASPQKVGVRTAGVPCLVKELQDTDGNTSKTKTDTSFRFVIYEGTAIALPNAYTQEDVFSALAGSTFTVVELTVKAGQSTSQAIALDGLHCYRYENGSLVETDTPWVWKKLTRYTLLELPLSSDSIYQFGSFNKTQPNNYTFAYDASVTQLFTCTNICTFWNIQVEKQCADTQTILSGAVFGLYSPSAEDLISDEKLSEQTAQLQNIPQKVLEVDNITWYLMDIQVTDENGQILWNDLVEDQYYLLELQAPDGYVLNEQPGQVITADATGTASVSVTNAPEYNLPLTGGSGVTGFYASGAALTGFSLLMGYRKKRKSKEKRES